MELTYSDRLKAIYDKEQSLSNAIIKGDYARVKEITDKDPQILTDKHIRLNNNLTDSSTPEYAASRSDISNELNYKALINSSTYYTERNELHRGNPTENLKTELSSKDPSHKEPIVYHLKNGADPKLITKENIERKLDDLNIKDYAGYKIAEDDQKEIVKFATIHAIKTNNVGALKDLEKEFAISKEIYVSEAFIKNNCNKETFNYLRDTSIITPKDDLSTGFISEQKLKILSETKQLEVAISRGNIDKVKEHIIAGADPKIITEKSLRHLDPNIQMDVFIAKNEAINLRNSKIPEHAKFDLKKEQNEKLKDAILNNEPLKAYNAIKSGADPASLSKSDFAHLNPIQANALKAELQRAVNDNAKNTLLNKKPEGPKL